MNLDDSTATRSNLLAALLRSPAAIGVARDGERPPARRSAQPRTAAPSPSAADDGKVAFFDALTLRRIGPAAMRPSDELELIRCSARAASRPCLQPPMASTLAVGSTDPDAATAELFNAQTHKPPGQSTPCRPTQSLTADVAFAPNGRTFATGEPLNGTMHPPPAVIVSWTLALARARAREPHRSRAGGSPATRATVVPSWSLPASRRSLLLDARTLEVPSDVSRRRSSGALAVSGRGRVRSRRRHCHPPRARLR